MKDMYDLRHYIDEMDMDDEFEMDMDLNVQKQSKKEAVSLRRKKSYSKARKRLHLLDNLPGITIKESDRKIIGGMLRSHQLPISKVIRAEHKYGCSVSNKKRKDAAEYECCETVLI